MENQKHDKVKCEFCGKEVSAKGLKTHIRMKHGEESKSTETATEITSTGPGETKVATEAIPVVMETADIPEVKGIAPVEVDEAPKAHVSANELGHKHNHYKNRKG